MFKIGDKVTSIQGGTEGTIIEILDRNVFMDERILVVRWNLKDVNGDCSHWTGQTYKEDVKLRGAVLPDDNPNVTFKRVECVAGSNLTARDKFERREIET